MSPKRKAVQQLSPATMSGKLLGCGHAKTLATGVQYCGTSEDWDGVSEWQCHCGRRWGRWTGRELTGHEIESRYGGRPAIKLSDVDQIASNILQAGRKTQFVYGADSDALRLSKQDGSE